MSVNPLRAVPLRVSHNRNKMIYWQIIEFEISKARDGTNSRLIVVIQIADASGKTGYKAKRALP